MLIGLCGLKWNGKSTIAKHLKDCHDFEHTKFAGSIVTGKQIGRAHV